MDLTSYIASMSVSMAQANVAQSVSTAMLSKSIDSIEPVSYTHLTLPTNSLV